MTTTGFRNRKFKSLYTFEQLTDSKTPVTARPEIAALFVGVDRYMPINLPVTHGCGCVVPMQVYSNRPLSMVLSAEEYACDKCFSALPISDEERARDYRKLLEDIARYGSE